MAKLYSNEVKAIVVPENFLDNPANVLKDHCMTVLHFDYQCEHKLNASGEVYGATQPVVLKFTVRVNSPSHVRVFYRNLVTDGYFCYSFLFNASFNDNMRLADYEDGMVVEGSILSIEEKYSSLKNQKGEDEQILLNVKLLARSVTYMGMEENNHYQSVFIQ